MVEEKSMTKVKCQICGAEISGLDDEEAREKLEEHIGVTHSDENPASRLKPWLERTD